MEIKTYPQIKQFYQQVQELCTNEFNKNRDYQLQDFDLFFAGYFCGKRDNFKILQKLFPLLQPIREELIAESLLLQQNNKHQEDILGTQELEDKNDENQYENNQKQKNLKQEQEEENSQEIPDNIKQKIKKGNSIPFIQDYTSPPKNSVDKKNLNKISSEENIQPEIVLSPIYSKYEKYLEQYCGGERIQIKINEESNDIKNEDDNNNKDDEIDEEHITIQLDRKPRHSQQLSQQQKEKEKGISRSRSPLKEQEKEKNEKKSEEFQGNYFEEEKVQKVVPQRDNQRNKKQPKQLINDKFLIKNKSRSRSRSPTPEILSRLSLKQRAFQIKRQQEQLNEQEKDQLENKQNKQNQQLKNNKNQKIQKANSIEDALEQIKQFEENERQSKLEIQKLEVEQNQLLQQRIKQEGEKNICEICTCELFEGDVDIVPLQKCPHIFHKNCMQQYINTEIDKKNITFKCPEADCKQELLIGDFKSVLEDKQYEKFLGFSLSTFVDKNSDQASWCPTADCEYIFILSGDDKNNHDFTCPLCKKNYCLNCKAIFHKGQTCKEFLISNKRDENDIKFEKYVKGKKYKQCPHCAFWVSKAEGCYNMTCKCGHTFCYVCGGVTVNYFCKICTDKQKEKQNAVLVPKIKKKK